MIEAMVGDAGGATRAWGDADQALPDLYRVHYRSLVRLAALLLDDVGASEEVVQEAFIKMHGAWRRLREPDKALAYLRQTTINLARSRMRHRLVARKHAPKPMPDTASAESSAMEALERNAVVAALRTLPVRQREAMVLRYYADLTEPAIAEAMGLSTGAVKSHLHRGRAAVAQILESQS